jgi:ATP-dependent helicase/nuclease subunit B
VGSLKLQLRVDRIDQVDGGRVIIDYKTGKVKTDSWDGARPEDPQLPIYAGFTEVQNVQGVLLGRVSDEKLEYSGRVAETSTVFSSQSTLLKPAYTEAMLQQWKADLLNLADQYLRGEAQVDPKQYPKTCQYCELPGLCRVAESARATGEAADPAEGEAD